MSSLSIAMGRSRLSALLGVILVGCLSSAVGGDVSLQLIEIEDGLTVEIASIGGGRFRMGDVAGNGQRDEHPVREVQVADFWIMRTEVTRGLFAAFAADTGHQTDNSCWVFEDGWRSREGLSWQRPGFDQNDQHPVTCVNWHDAQAFAVWLSDQAGLEFRLPTEAEWEYVTRAGAGSTYYWGDDPAGLCETSNAADTRALEHYPGFAVNSCDDGFVRTAPVALFKPNPNGVFDLYGNVWEWVADCWNTSYTNAPVDGSAWLAGDCTQRGFRGGGYGDIPHFARSGLRNRSNATDRKDDIGFRLVLEKDKGPGRSESDQMARSGRERQPQEVKQSP